MSDLLPGWTLAGARAFAADLKAEHAPAQQTMPDGTPNPYDRCAVCNFTSHPCDTRDLAALLIAALNRLDAAGYTP